MVRYGVTGHYLLGNNSGNRGGGEGERGKTGGLWSMFPSEGRVENGKGNGHSGRQWGEWREEARLMDRTQRRVLLGKVR